MRYTRSVCPVCLKPVTAALTEKDGVTYLEKCCPEHGTFSVPVWHGRLDMDTWRAGAPELAVGEGLHCPENCGICKEHESGTCCALLEVTERCNLHCRFCFAGGGESENEPALDELMLAVACIMEMGRKPTLQLSGGEPTLRDDLPELVAYAKSIGCPYVQLNTNGLRLAEDEAYVQALAEAGLSFVFLQFDGVTDNVYETLRGERLLEKKLAAIQNCDRHGLGVTLVPTVVRGVNDRQLGDIVRLATSLSPTVRGVHFQPVSYFGRYPDAPEERYTLDELICDLCGQLDVGTDCLVPSHCDHPMCGFHGSFVVMPDGKLLPLSSSSVSRTDKTTAEQNRDYVARHWIRKQGTGQQEKSSGATLADGDEISLDVLLDRLRTNSFTLTAMAFQDAMNLDIERLRRCSLHVWHDYRLIPFCVRYLTPMKAR
jgi:7,8-dihydro-6-hydroxymethylpterin dimethyltransferase